jgi:competence protein ComEA
MADKPSSTSPAAPEAPVCARPTQIAVVLMISVALLLIGWRWIGDRLGTRPAELQRDVPVVAHRVDINKAGRTELMQLPGIGPGRADKILSYRQSKGGFQRVEDLRRVDGIGEATLTRVKPWLTVVADEGDDSIRDEPELLLRKPAVPDTTKLSTKKPAPDGLIDVNRATLAELQGLPGIGPALAQRIVDERAKKPFAKVEDLRRVSGIGAKRLDQIKPFVAISN